MPVIPEIHSSSVTVCIDEALLLAIGGDMPNAIGLLDAALAVDGLDVLDIARLSLVRERLVTNGDEDALRRIAATQPTLSWRVHLGRAQRAIAAGEATATVILQQALRDFRAQSSTFGDFAPVLSRLISLSVERVGDSEGRRTKHIAAGAPLESAQLVRLVELGRDLATATDPEAVVRRVLRGAMVMCGAERGFVVLKRGDALEVAASEAIDRTEIDHPALAVSRTLLAETFDSGRPQQISVASSSGAVASMSSLSERGVTYVACVPISSREGPLGALYLDRRGDGDEVSRVADHVLELFATLVGEALTGARRRQEDARSLEVAREALKRERSETRLRSDYHGIVGASQAMQEVYRRLDTIIPADLPLLILGETGTGKELIARASHDRGPRCDGPFLALNCAGMTDSLLESELFGYEKGAFTGADRGRPGLFEAADGGTLFLDEVGDMSASMQAHLLRVLESGEIRRLGGREAYRVDVRVVAATHRDLSAEARDGRFRRDLFYRLNVARIALPALRERVEDIPLLVDALLRRFLAEGENTPTVTGALMRELQRLAWPGNVRELDNVVRRLAVQGVDPIDVDHLPLDIVERTVRRAPGTLRAAETEAIRAALEASDGNKAEAARILGIDRKTLYARLKDLDAV